VLIEPPVLHGEERVEKRRRDGVERKGDTVAPLELREHAPVGGADDGGDGGGLALQLGAARSPGDEEHRVGDDAK